MTHQIEVGSVLDVLAGLPNHSFNAIMCDPPYGFSFMGKKWDYDVPSVETWAECLRVLKPGAPLVAFGGSRTYHRLACGIEDAGFELRDQLMWLYGKGFPKSQNIGLAIDKSAGAVREVVGTRTLTGNAAVSLKDKGGTYGVQVGTVPAKTVNVTAPATDLAKAWDGYGTALKPAFEPIVLARKPLDGTMVQNVARWGVGGLAIDACRVEGKEWTQEEWTAKGASRPSRNTYGEHGGSDTEVPSGRWPANLVLSHSEHCHFTGQTREAPGFARNRFTDGAKPFGGGAGHEYTSEKIAGGTVEVWECAPDCPIALLDAQAAPTKSTPYPEHTAPGAVLSLTKRTAGGYSDSGGPSRFFYCSKVSTKEREAGCEGLALRSAGEVTERDDDTAGLDSPRAGAGRTGGARNHHPTLKPLSLTTWLARLIMPPSPGAILVPFAGAGSEMIGARKAGWPSVFGIERDAEYAEIAQARLTYWCSAHGCLEFDRQLSLLSVVGGK